MEAAGTFRAGILRIMINNSTNNYCSYLVQLDVWAYISQGKKKIKKNFYHKKNNKKLSPTFLDNSSPWNVLEVYPSGYAYLGRAVLSHEKTSINCRNSHRKLCIL